MILVRCTSGLCSDPFLWHSSGVSPTYFFLIGFALLQVTTDSFCLLPYQLLVAFTCESGMRLRRLKVFQPCCFVIFEWLVCRCGPRRWSSSSEVCHFPSSLGLGIWTCHCHLSWTCERISRSGLSCLLLVSLMSLF